MNCQELIQKGVELKESGKTNSALELYKKALDISETSKDKKDAWMHILHIHTDKMLSVLIEIADVYECNVYDLVQIGDNSKKFEWVFGTNKFIQGTNEPQVGKYFRPSKESLFK